MSDSMIAAPISWTPSSYWDGNDGLWNSFIVEVGTPTQEFRVFPSTAGQELWIPVPEGCTAASPDNTGYCGYLRGTLPVNGANSSGYKTNESSTWEAIGIYTLYDQQAALGYSGNGSYGFETVLWGNGNTPLNLTGQIVAGIADPDWWLGQVGLGPKVINFTDFNSPIPSYLSSLVNESIIPSHSWGYTAGAAYRDRAPASLTLGGYDTNRFEQPGLSVSMNADNSRPLQVAVQRILAENTLGGTQNVLPTATYHFVDSTVPHIWLPEDSIDAFVAAFGLTYDNSTDLFLVNDTIHERLLELNPTITFVLADTIDSPVGSTQNIVLPYAAFDLQATYPFYQNATNYFPIRRAANDTQHTIGRTLFQEAYIIADHERSNFTISQTSFDSLDAQQLIAIRKPSTSNETDKPSSEPGNDGSLSGGTIGGIVVGAIAGLALIGFLLWFFIFRKKRQEKQVEKVEHVEYPEDKKSSSPGGPELPPDTGIHEAPTQSKLPHEIGTSGAQAAEIDSSKGWGRQDAHEMHSPGNTWTQAQELHTPPIGHENGILAEAPGSEGRRYELPDKHSTTR